MAFEGFIVNAYVEFVGAKKCLMGKGYNLNKLPSKYIANDSSLYTGTVVGKCRRYEKVIGYRIANGKMCNSLMFIDK